MKKEQSVEENKLQGTEVTESSKVEENDNDIKLEESNSEKASSNKLEEYKLDSEIIEDRSKMRKEKISFGKAIKQSFTSKNFKYGAYSSIVTTIVVIVVLVANFIISELDLKVDLSEQKYYTLTSKTKDFVKGIDDKITIYYIAESGNEDSLIKRIVDKYDSLGSNIDVVVKDPVVYPRFTSDYVDDSETVSDNSLIVVDETNGRSKYIPYRDLYKTEVDYSTYQETTTGIDVEGQVTSAIQYVVSEDLPNMYTVTGHGESEINATLASFLAKQNVNTKNLDTISTESIPEDCSLLLLNGPQYDYTEAEAKLILDYLKKGGDAIILANYEGNISDMPNFSSILNYYGVSLVDSYVIEGDSGYYMSNMPTYLLPTIESNDITSDIRSSKKPVVMAAAKGIQKLDEVRSTVTVEPLLTTSDKAYSKTNLESKVYDKEDSDIAGPFYLGVAVTEKVDDVETKLVVYSSNYLVDENMITYDQLGNVDLLMSSINWMADVKTEALGIAAKLFDSNQVTIPESDANQWSVFTILILPAAFLVTGIVVWARRRRR
ncbi:MAG TPA: Gldg family protein [Lachnospiraceae bacterium]|nr:Gldg family protein [Lachnospiraceae bacterium]